MQQRRVHAFSHERKTKKRTMENDKEEKNKNLRFEEKKLEFRFAQSTDGS